MRTGRDRLKKTFFRLRNRAQMDKHNVRKVKEFPGFQQTGEEPVKKKDSTRKNRKKMSVNE